jgi:hypothetical protein
VLNIRTCDATVGDFVFGVRVPVDALYSLKDDRTSKESIGVIVLDGGIQTFVEVIVISYTDDNMAFVRPTLSGSPLEAGKTVMLYTPGLPEAPKNRALSASLASAQRELKNWGVLFTDGSRKRLITAEEAKIMRLSGEKPGHGAVMTPLAKEILEGSD